MPETRAAGQHEEVDKAMLTIGRRREGADVGTTGLRSDRREHAVGWNGLPAPGRFFVGVAMLHYSVFLGD